MLVLGIESSCDDTSAAVVQDGEKILSNVVSSQTDLHRQFGGIVPELAARQHIENIIPVIDRALINAGVRMPELAAVAVTARPGLIGSLVVGLAAAKAIAYAAGIPLIGINHIEAHGYANCFAGLNFLQPRIDLIVSGGHTLLIENLGYSGIRVLGGTVDDAAGEAFDKVAKIAGLGFPGGPAIQKVALTGDPHSIPLPRPMRESHDLRMSFSGLKTAVRYFLQNNVNVNISNLAASFQEAVADILTFKACQALRDSGHKILGVAGGVAANTRLREMLGQMCADLGVEFFAPPPILCTDNAAMVAGLAAWKMKAGLVSDLDLNAVATGHPSP